MRQVWGAVYGRLATALGWTFPQIDDLLMSDLEDLAEYWRTSPPVHELVAGFLEYKPPAQTGPLTEEAHEAQQRELEDLIRSMTP